MNSKIVLKMNVTASIVKYEKNIDCLGFDAIGAFKKNSFTFLMLCFSSMVMSSTVFAEIDDSIPQASQKNQAISEYISTEQIGIGNNESNEIQTKTLENRPAKSRPASLVINQDLKKLVEIKNIGQLFNGIQVMTNENVHVANGTDSTRKITEKHGVRYRTITYGKIVSGNCQYGFTMVEMRFRQDQGLSSFIDYIIEPPATSRCLPVTNSIELLVGQTVALAHDENNTLGVIEIKR